MGHEQRAIQFDLDRGHQVTKKIVRGEGDDCGALKCDSRWVCGTFIEPGTLRLGSFHHPCEGGWVRVSVEVQVGIENDLSEGLVAAGIVGGQHPIIRQGILKLTGQE